MRLLSTGEHGTLACGCGAVYPVVDDVPIVLRDLEAWIASEGAEALRRLDLPPATEALLARGAVARNRALADAYTRSAGGPLSAWLRARRLDGLVLEVGAGVGALGRDDVVALDLNLALLRRHPARVRVCGDAADPPFLGGCFDALVLANVLDSCADPALVLAQADALLRPGGTLVVTCAYAFRDDVTPPARRFRPEELLAALDGGAPFRGYALPHRIVDHADHIEWTLRTGERVSHVYEVQGIVSKKAAS